MASYKKIGIIVGQPTQFEGPLFQYIAKKNFVDLEVIYYNSERMYSVYDPELKMDINWGIDLLSGYKYFVLPEKNKFIWLKKKFKSGGYDLLIINGYNRIILLYSIMLGKIYSKSIALRLDTVEFQSESNSKKIIKKLIYLFFKIIFDHFFAVGTLTKKYLHSMGIPDYRISIFSYVVDNDFFKDNSELTPDEKNKLREKLSISDDANVIICVAKFSKREAPWDLLKVFSLIKDLNVHLLLVGDGPKRNELEEYAINNFKKWVTFTGYVKYPELPKYYGISDLFVHSSNNEPWGVSVQEALACGLPVIASDKVGSGFDLIREGKNGFIYNTGDIHSLKEKIKIMLNGNNKEAIMQENDKVLAGWNFEIVRKNILKVLEE